MNTARERVTVVSWNTHVGAGIRTGGLAWILEHLDPDVLLLQEVQSAAARLRLRRALGRAWKIHGLRPPSTSRGSAGTIVATRRAKFRFVTGTNRLVSRYLDRMHPTRRNTVGWYKHRSTGKRLVIVSMHTWTLFGSGADPRIRPGHQVQVHAYAAACRAGRADGAVVICGGDVNESTGAGTSPVEQRMSEAGMYDSRDWTNRRRLIDAIWISKGTHSSGWGAVTVPGPNTAERDHHPAIVVQVTL